jgi:hypothetical protein
MKLGTHLSTSLFLALAWVSCGSDQPGPAHDASGELHDHRVYYGLNESHSRSWAQVADDGLVGITYFQHDPGTNDEGTLVYRTIHPDGSADSEAVTTGRRLEKSVLLFDAVSNPHIFVARSEADDQTIDHYHGSSGEPWQSETILHFRGEGGRFIYELSAAAGPDHSFHLLILKTRSDVDSDDFNYAWLDSYLYHLTNASGRWEMELVDNYDMAYTYDWYIKSSSRQDIKVDRHGHVHVVFAEQINAADDPSRLRYATNATGSWVIETALSNDYGPRDDAGWFPSLALDSHGTPHVACMYVNRVITYSALYARLLLLVRRDDGRWQSEVVADADDGYYGGDGRNYTGALAHLVLDSRDTPHIVFSDIASTHWPGTQRMNVGNIRYAVRENGAWDIRTIYRESLPRGFFEATEMHGMCLLVSERTHTVRVVGQELVVTTEADYSSRLLDFAWDE